MTATQYSIKLEDWEPNQELAQKQLFFVEFFGFSIGAWTGFDDLYDMPATIGITLMPVARFNEDEDSESRALVLTISWLKSALAIEFEKKTKG
jgi:hypothetical protein